MPKNPHPPRGPAKGKKRSTTASTDEDTSYIVFSNSKSEQKKGKKSETPSAAENSANVKGKSKESSNPSNQDDAAKKPDTRTLIGGASWTGKLPVTLLSEHCQKQKWHKPEYTMTKVKEGFRSSVILKTENPKTREVTTLAPFQLPPPHQELSTQPTAVEARHFAAAYALFRVGNMRSLHMSMPPKYRDLWKGTFTDLMKEDQSAGGGWKYEADPFMAKKEREEAAAAAEKRRQDIQKRRDQDSKQPGFSGSNPGDVNTKSSSGANLKGWTRAVRVEMGRKTRTQVESLVRRYGAWNPHQVSLSGIEQSKLIEEVTGLGFRRSHVEEATKICKDREEVLEWLLIHVPEDDSPAWALPENYVAGVSMATGDLKREAKIKRLSVAGYTSEVCEEVLDDHNGDELLAAQALQEALVKGGTTNEQDLGRNSNDKSIIPHQPDSLQIWKEEQDVLKSILGDRYTDPENSAEYEGCNIQLEVHQTLDQTFTLRVRRPSVGYPNKLPIISLEAKIPAYIRLSITKQAVEHARANFLGEQMLFNIVDWLEQEIPRITENPGRLSEIATKPSATSKIEGLDGDARGYSGHHRKPKPIDWTPDTTLSQIVLQEWQSKQNIPAGQQMLRVRQSLPAWKMQEAIVNTVSANQVVIISGETGSGKSTQSVQFILDDMIKRKLGGAANIICTQPRRISALGLADRVANERCSKVGDEVGYSIRGESRMTQGRTRITFVTTGVLLRRLQTSGGRTDDVVDALANVSHVVVDEVHERSLDTDFLLILLRDVLAKRKELKVILMSATLDAEIFENYFRPTVSVGRVEIEGRTHPVHDHYLDDVVRMTGFSGYSQEAIEGTNKNQTSLSGTLRSIGMAINYELIGQTVVHIDRELAGKDGAILIFLPGTAEIDKTLQVLRGIPNLTALPLHASLQSSEQRQVFPPPPRGKRKVIAATNVAETSITIEDVVAVIDAGRVKETIFDPENNMVKLEEVWASRAACKQRRGRAGRVRAGKCYKLYTQSAEMNKMAERPEPEIKRVPLEQLCLSVKAMGISNVPSFLASALTPPSSLAVENALDVLERMSALDGQELTALGRHLAMIPADLRCGKLLVYGAIFSCLEACLTIAAILTVKSPFVSPQSKREESKSARSSFGNGQGDLLCDLRAYEGWSEQRQSLTPHAVKIWCGDNFLSSQTLFDITSNRIQHLSSLKDAGFIPANYQSSRAETTKTYNSQNGNNALLRTIVAGAFNPQIARIEFPDKKFAASMSGAVELDPEARAIKYFNQENGRVFVHPSSTVFNAQAFPGSSTFMSYFSKMATSKVFIRELTPFNAYSLLLFSGSIQLDTLGRGLVIDGWLRLRGWARIGVLVSRLRLMLDEILAKKIDDPALGLEGNKVIDTVRRLVELNGLDQ
ncbi:P-loop containing nucleoside triphosphate hydrolase protein [Viridothelium virens]|uniref:P-loop containing nucleoside triphosphate hydrolase protein n=1 Tax=Viridothelium virens TaxID=1048519 RepID=A0A6A6HNC3_VIRVR|nr:P-loop containing nucleoside triphosphate hydrolase protein [Viridothelium virens]